MAVIFTAEQAAQITTALVSKINEADTKATNAATAAATADTKAANAATAAAAADTKATNAATAAETAQTTAENRQQQLYKHIVHLGNEVENYASDVIIEVISANNANLTTAEIVVLLNSRECSIQLVPSANTIPLNYNTDFTISGTSLISQAALLSTSGSYDVDAFEFTIANITQTTTAL